MKIKYFICIVFFTSCFAQAQTPENLTFAKKAVRDYYQSGQHEKDVASIASEAEAYLLNRVAESKGKLALVLDVDDTSISNFPAINKDDFSLLHVEEFQKEAKAPAIKPILRLYNTALTHGVSVFFITMRSEDMRSYTITNLERAGFYGWTGLYLPKDDESTADYKANVRKKLVEDGYTIILNIGDQYTDIDGGYADKTYKLPNFLYSSTTKRK